ncbi:putative ribonuclease H protein [Vitis vinifera]|uniref:Putative ribonuclease H protein n=1 Tax=Vitis vinifera TaxID=29760 RepID=A0A438EVY1_VITVI|nr:putative ribonuclease H protein [Vitis vinifera]
MSSIISLTLERIQRGFLWGGGALERKIHLVRWELVCLEKDNGGLGVKSLSILNKALLCKWSWRFAMEREAFWNQVIRGKYGEEQGGWSSKEARGEGHGVGLWKTLRKEWEVVKIFFVALNRKQIQQGVDDRVIWRETNCGKFSVKSLYKSLVSGHPISFPSSAIWKVTVQPRVSFFWVGSNVGKALTLDQLQRRGWALANKCYLCQRHEESIDHILLHCDKARELFGCCFSLCSGCSGCCQPRLRRRFRGGMGLLWGRRGRVFGKQVLCAFFGRFGRQGTKLLFEEEELSIQRLKTSFIYFLWSEMKRSIKDGPLTLVDFVGLKGNPEGSSVGLALGLLPSGHQFESPQGHWRQEHGWARLKENSHAEQSLAWSKKANGAVGVGVWKEILKESDWCWDNMVFLAGRAPKSDFGKIFGALIHRCSIASLTSLLWLRIGMQRLRNVGLKFWPSLEEDSVMWRRGRNGDVGEGAHSGQPPNKRGATS